MPESENPQNHSNAAPISSNGPLDIIQEGMKRMNIIEKRDDCVVDEGIEYPDRPGEPDCLYYLKTGRCGYAATCRYNHPPRPRPVQTEQSKDELPQREGQPDCGHFLRTGHCKYGSTCKYHHPLDRHGAEEVPLNTLGLPLRKEKPCPYYLRTHHCKFGSACKFDHPQPTSVEAALPVSGPTSVGMGSSSLSPSISYVAPLPAWSWGKSPTSPGAHGLMPYYYYPNPAVTQNWNSYLGNMSSVAAASGVVGTDFAYKNPGELVPGQADLLKMASSIYPERPDEPECRFYMSTGGCRFGSNCKYHHPKDRIGHCLGPHGLPLRPGAALCGNFSSYNVCNYGATCKYDHPFTGYGYYFGVAHGLAVNQPFIPNPKCLPVANSTDQSKSSKITDWIQKPETVGGKNSQQSVTKAIEDSHDKVADQSNAVAAASAEIPKDQSN